jgi:hypothetical protein
MAVSGSDPVYSAPKQSNITDTAGNPQANRLVAAKGTINLHLRVLVAAAVTI